MPNLLRLNGEALPCGGEILADRESSRLLLIDAVGLEAEKKRLNPVKLDGNIDVEAQSSTETAANVAAIAAGKFGNFC